MYSVCGTCAPRGEHCSGNCATTLKRILANDKKAQSAEQAQGGGPRTAGGKAVSARNATTHGLFARDIVLPALGEDPEGYRQIEAEFTAQIAPRNLLERHYVEKIAAASWRLRRLHRWQAQLFEDETLTEDERLDKLDKVLRHENQLHRTGGPGGPADRHRRQDAEQRRAAACPIPRPRSSVADHDADGTGLPGKSRKRTGSDVHGAGMAQTNDPRSPAR